MTRKLTLSRSRAGALSSTHHGCPLTSKLDESIDDSCLTRLAAYAHMRPAGIRPVGRFLYPGYQILGLDIAVLNQIFRRRFGRFWALIWVLIMVVYKLDFLF